MLRLKLLRSAQPAGVSEMLEKRVCRTLSSALKNSYSSCSTDPFEYSQEYKRKAIERHMETNTEWDAPEMGEDGQAPFEYEQVPIGNDHFTYLVKKKAPKNCTSAEAKAYEELSKHLADIEMPMEPSQKSQSPRKKNRKKEKMPTAEKDKDRSSNAIADAMKADAHALSISTDSLLSKQSTVSCEDLIDKAEKSGETSSPISLAHSLESEADRLQKAIQTHSLEARDRVLANARLTKFRSFKLSDINTESMNQLARLVYQFAFAGISLSEYIPWFPSAIAKGSQFMSPDATTMMVAAVSHAGCLRELGLMGSQIIQNIPKFTAKHLTKIALDFADHGLYTNHPKLLEKLIPHCSFSYAQSAQLLHSVKNDKLLYKYLAPMVGPSAKEGKGPLHAVNALCILKWEGAQSEAEKQSETELIHAIGHMIRSISSGMRITTPDMIQCLSTVARSKEKYTIKPLKLLTAMGITGGHFNAADNELNARFMLMLMDGQCPELLGPVISAIKCRVHQDEHISCVFHHFGKMKIRHEVLELCRKQNIPNAPAAKETGPPGVTLCVLNKLIQLLGKPDAIVKSRSLPIIMRFYAETKNQVQILALLRNMQVYLAAMKKELQPSSTNEKESITHPRMTFLRDYLIICTRLSLKLSHASPIHARCAEVVHDALHLASLKNADDFFVWTLLKYLDLSLLSNESFAELTTNVEAHRTPEECHRLYRILQNLPATLQQRVHPIMTAALRKVPIAHFTKLMKTMSAAQEQEFYQIMEERAAEFDYDNLLPYLLDRSARMIPTHQLLEKLVKAASRNPENVTPRAYLETLLAYGRRNIYPGEFALKHVEKFMKISSMQINDAVHALYMICRSNHNKTDIHNILPQICAKFAEWSSMKYIKPQEISLLCRAVYVITKWTDKSLAEQFKRDYFNNIAHIQTDRDLQGAYCFLVISSRLEDNYDALEKIITEHGKSESLPWCFETLAHNKIPSIIHASAKRATEVVLAPKDLISILYHWKEVSPYVRGISLEEVVLPVLQRVESISTKRKYAGIDARALTEIISHLNRFGHISDTTRAAALACFQRICHEATDYGSILTGLTKLDVDLHRYANSVASVFSKQISKLSVQQIGFILNAFVKVDTFPREICNMVLPRLRTLLPTLGALDFTHFVYPLLRCEALPIELGELLAENVKLKKKLLSASQATRLINVLNKPYAPSDIREQLHTAIIVGTPALRFQEAVGLLASEHTYNSGTLVDRLRERLRQLTPTCSALDINWAIRAVSKTAHKGILGDCLMLFLKNVPKLNNYEATVLLTSLLVSGITEPREFVDALLHRIRECAGKELKGNNLLTLMNSIMRSHVDVSTPVSTIMEILLEKCELNVAFLAQLAEFCARHSDNASLDFSPVYERIAKEATAIIHVAPRSALSLLGAVKPGMNPHRLTFECLSNTAARLLPIEEIAPLLTHNPEMLLLFTQRIEESLDTMGIGPVGAALSALQYTSGVQNAAEMREKLLDSAERQCDVSCVSPNTSEASVKGISGLSAVQCARGYAGGVRPGLVAAIVEKCIVPKELAYVPPQLCFDTFVYISGEDISRAARVAFDPIIGALLHRVFVQLDSIPIESLLKLLHAMYALEIDDDIAVVKVFRRVQDLKDMFLVHQSLLKPILEIAHYFGANLIPRTASMLQRLNEIPKIF